MNVVKPLVSVLMPVFNREDFVKQAINSILQQTYKNIELIVCDDCSTDNTRSVIQATHDPRLKLICNERNMGISYTRNRLLKNCNGEFIGLLDSDDLALPDRIERQVGYLFKHREVSLVGGACVVIDKDGRQLKQEIKYETDPEDIRCALLFRNCFVQSTILFKRSILKDFFYNEGLTHAEDYELWGRLSLRYKLVNLNSVVGLYRVHSNNNDSLVKEQSIFEINKMLSSNLIRHYFGIIPTHKELAIHKYMYSPNTYEDPNFIAYSSYWLKKLNQLNKSKQVFKFSIFRKHLAENWYMRFRKLIENKQSFSIKSFLKYSPTLSFKIIYQVIVLFIKKATRK